MHLAAAPARMAWLLGNYTQPPPTLAVAPQFEANPRLTRSRRLSIRAALNEICRKSFIRASLGGADDGI